MRRPRQAIPVGLALLGLLLAATACGDSGAGAGAGSTPPGRSAPVATADAAFIARGPIADEQTVLGSMATKTAITKQEDQAQTDAANGPAGSKNPNYVPPSNPMVPAVPARMGIRADPGTLDSGTGMFYHFTNSWLGIVGTVHTSVVAGSLADDSNYGTFNDPQQGFLIVRAVGSSHGEYTTPTRAGQLTITGFARSCLDLTATNGTVFHFELSTRTWVTTLCSSR